MVTGKQYEANTRFIDAGLRYVTVTKPTKKIEKSKSDKNNCAIDFQSQPNKRQ